MGKRSSNFERKKRDFYPTPPECVESLIPHLIDYQYFIEPCAGDGALVDAIEDQTHMHCRWLSDIEPNRQDIMPLDALDITHTHAQDAEVIITNPPWTRDIFHNLISHLTTIRPTWLLADADWIHTKQSSSFTNRSSLKKIVSVGRVKWFGNTTGKDNACWYLFDRENTSTPKFYGRLV
mgnify:FL=1